MTSRSENVFHLSSDGIKDAGTARFSRVQLYQTTYEGVPHTVLRFINDEKHEAVACAIPRDPFVKLIVDNLLSALTGALGAMNDDMTAAIRQLTRDA